MLRNLLSPLRTGFDPDRRSPSSPRSALRNSLSVSGPSPTAPETPEDFQRDVRMDIMRRSTEELKEGATSLDVEALRELLDTILHLMVEDSTTVQVFRELDGALGLLSAFQEVCARMQVELSGRAGETKDVDVEERLRVLRTAFEVLAELLKDRESRIQFHSSLGFESLSSALRPLASSPLTSSPLLNNLLSLSLSTFTPPILSFFSPLSTPPPSIFSTTPIRNPKAVGIMMEMLQDLGSFAERAALVGGLLQLAQSGAYNLAQLSQPELDLARPVITLLFPSSPSSPPSPTSTPPSSYTVDPSLRPLLLKLLQHLLHTSCSTPSARALLSRAVNPDSTLNNDVLDVLAEGLDTMADGFGWPSFLTLGADAMAQCVIDRGTGSAGFTFLAWLYLPRPHPKPTPSTSPQPLFTLQPNPPVSSRFTVQLSIRNDASLQYETSSSNGPVHLAKSRLRWGEWIQVGLAHSKAPGAGEAPCRIFLNGHLTDGVSIPYPKLTSSLQMTLGSLAPSPLSTSISTSLSPPSRPFYLGPTLLFSHSLPSDLLPLLRALGPHYTGKYQASLLRFLTYGAATGLNLRLSAAAPNNASASSSERGRGASASGEAADVAKALRDGVRGSDGGAVNALVPARLGEAGDRGDEDVVPLGRWTLHGDAAVTKLQPLYAAVYWIGGPSLGLRLVKMSESEHELHSSIRILLGMLAHSWRNSEEMETLNGYDVLANILRHKTALISEEILRTMLTFVGVDYGAPDRSVIINTVAYKTLLLDFDLWCRTPTPVQLAHLAHFSLFLKHSTHRRFNINHRYAKLGIVRSLLHALRYSAYREEVWAGVVDAIRSVISYHFSKDHSIKPLVTYLAINLHEDSTSVSSPLSTTLPRLDQTNARPKALLVLHMLVQVLHMPDHLSKFCSALPVARILLLLLGDNPSPELAVEVLTLLGMVIKLLPSFPRKFELANGWGVLRFVLPGCWDGGVQEAAFDVLLGRTEFVPKMVPEGMDKPSVCPWIMPAIIAVLFRGLDDLTADPSYVLVTKSDDVSEHSDKNTLEALAEALIELLGTQPDLFRSKVIVAQFIENGRLYLPAACQAGGMSPSLRSLVDKISHMTALLSLDDHVPAAQQRQLRSMLESCDNLPSEDKISTSSKQNSASWKSAEAEVAANPVLQHALARSRVWRQKLAVTEKARARGVMQDLRESRQSTEQQTAWEKSLHSGQEIWGSTQLDRIEWKVDETEGPFRSRKKLEPEEIVSAQEPSQGYHSSSLPKSGSREIESIYPDDNGSVLQQELPPWAESDLDLAQGVDPQLDEDAVVEDKRRRVRRHLEPGDVIQAVSTVYKIVGIDSSPALFIMGKTSLYILEGLVETSDGEIIDARDAPKDLLSVPSGTVVELKGHQSAVKWSYDDLAGFSKRTCLFRDVALEIYMRDNRSLLLVFSSRAERQSVYDRLTYSQNPKAATEVPSTFTLRTPLLSAVNAVSAVSGRFSSVVAGRGELDSATRKWQAREISNYAYLAIINQAAGRTPNDITQYPVFPWILRDYASKRLDLSLPETFRDLTCPMGALTPERRNAALERYEAQAEMEGEKPFHYGTHFSSSMIVCHFLLRLSPFTHMFRVLQGGNFDLAERLFRDVGKAWDSAASESRGDVRELIPEFFTCPEFLENLNNLDLGKTLSGEKVDSVTLPPWAHKDPLLFISLHRTALESDHVSKMLPRWIDLIFGCKQRDQDALNVFHPLTYEGAIDLETIKESWEREATIGAIHNFGQTPRQVFRSPHPDRYMDGKTSLPLGTTYGIPEDYALLVQSANPTRQSSEPVNALYVDAEAERVLPCPAHRRLVPHLPHESVEWSHSDGTLSLHVDRKLVHMEEEVSVTSGAFYDSRLLVTGNQEGFVSLWRIIRRGTSTLQLAGTMRGHRSSVNSVATSRPWALAVTASEDGSVVVWDVNRMRYIRSFRHDAAVQCVAVDPAGDIASSSRSCLMVHTINGHMIASFKLSTVDTITSLAFHDREYCSVPVLAAGSLGEIKLWSWNADDTPDGEAAQWKLVTLRTMKCSKVRGHITSVTALEFVGESLYHGDDLGAVYAWTLPE